MEERITIEPGKRSGQPCIREPAHHRLGCTGLAVGETEEQILADYPELEPADFRAVFEYASHAG